MKNQETVSIIIPVYNAEKYLDRCIQSILKQTYQNWETIFVNDGSTDGSLSILQSYADKDSRFRIINKPNGGASSARNAGIDAARTRYLTFVDADDSILPDLLRKLLSAALTHGSDYVATSLRFQGKDCGMPISGKISTASPAYFMYVNPGPVAKLYNKEIIDQHKLRFADDLVIAEDYLFTISYAILSRTTFIIPEALYHYHFDSDESLIHRLAQNNMHYNEYRSNIEAPWRALQFLISQKENLNSQFIADFSLGIYRNLWKMYYNTIKHVLPPDKKRLRALFRLKHHDFIPYIPLLKRLTTQQRHPRMVSFLKKARNILSGRNK